MINDWITIDRIKVVGAERLYPKGIDWTLNPGVNAIVGGTGLGKTTLVYAIQYGVFDKIIVAANERIEREFFANRLTKRSADQVKRDPPSIEVQFRVSGSTFVVVRNLLTGALIKATCDDVAVKSTGKYGELLASKVGVGQDTDALSRLQSHLLFFGESRYLLAWDNLVQNEILNLLLSDHSDYESQSRVWAEVESADSEARNLSAQASRLERDVEAYGGSSGVDELQRRNQLKDLESSRVSLEEQLGAIRSSLEADRVELHRLERGVAAAQQAFHATLDKLESEVGRDLDQELLATAEAESPTVSSIRHALQDFFGRPHDRSCPCCGRPGVAPSAEQIAHFAWRDSQSGHCVVCHKDLVLPIEVHKLPEARLVVSMDSGATKLQELMFQREQARSRIQSLEEDEASVNEKLARARADESSFLRDHPAASPISPLRVAAEELRRRQHSALRRRDKQVGELRKQLAKTNREFGLIQTKIGAAFKKYASLYLDEPCHIEFLGEDELPTRKGPQIKAPHAAFFPVVSGQTRPSASDLSDAQRSFIDLAFRMAVIDVWHQKTKKAVTFFIETPEGAVDIAYMERVASMLRAFASQGHTLVITTNLNNDIFLPELLASQKKGERLQRILNLIDHGSPRPVQKQHRDDFKKILTAVEDQRVTRG